MATFGAFIAVLVLVAAVALLLERSVRAGRLASTVLAIAGWPLLQLARAASRSLDLVLRASGSRRRIPAWRYVAWAVVGLIPMAAFFSLSIWTVPLPRFADPGYLLILGAGLHVFAVFAAYVIVHDDFDVMDGVVDAADRRIGGSRNSTRPVALALSIGLVAAYVIAIAWWLSVSEGVALTTVQPRTGWAVIDTILIGLRALPTDWLLGLLDRMTGNDTSVVFGDALVAQIYYFAVKGIGSVLLVGVVAIAIQEIWQLRRIVTEIGESDARHDYLIQRAILAPPVIKSGILRAAVTPQDADKQKRLIVASKEIGIFTLPQTFCHSVESFDSDVQVFGLDQCLEMFRHRSREFEAEQSERTLVKAAHVLRRAKLGVEPTKKLLRLMTAIVVLKRGTFVIPEQLRGMMEATIRAELDKPRAKEDPALRGFFRDLQSALNGAPAGTRPAPLPEKVEQAWAKRPAPQPTPPVAAAEDEIRALPPPEVLPEGEDPDAPPETPTPTVH
ncbi:MAG TPA: hypothetical protein VHA70_09040 [Bauldia sp.]|nr:hypothetical protein [Bauldia sp.]